MAEKITKVAVCPECGKYGVAANHENERVKKNFARAERLGFQIKFLQPFDLFEGFCECEQTKEILNNATNFNSP